MREWVRGLYKSYKSLPTIALAISILIGVIAFSGAVAADPVFGLIIGFLSGYFLVGYPVMVLWERYFET